MAVNRCLCLAFICFIEVVLSDPSSFTCCDVGIFPDPDDCRSFYTCDEDYQPEQGTCGEFGRFDPVEICVYGNCTTPITPPDTTSQPGVFVCPGEGTFPDPTDCHDFYSCDYDLVPTRSSCTEYGYYDEEKGNCLFGECPGSAATTEITTPSFTVNPGDEFSCTSPGYHPDPNNCRGYYMCSDSLIPVLHGICQGGTGIFNPETGGCERGSC